jgi:hypothetical protein
MTNIEFLDALESLLDAQTEGKEAESLQALQWLGTAFHPSKGGFPEHCQKYGLLQEDMEKGYWNRLVERESFSAQYVLRLEAGLISSSPDKPFSLQYRYCIETSEGKTLSRCSDFLEAVNSLKTLLQAEETASLDNVPFLQS